MSCLFNWNSIANTTGTIEKIDMSPLKITLTNNQTFYLFDEDVDTYLFDKLKQGQMINIEYWTGNNEIIEIYPIEQQIVKNQILNDILIDMDLEQSVKTIYINDTLQSIEFNNK